jgi:hypothetical protein
LTLEFPSTKKMKSLTVIAASLPFIAAVPQNAQSAAKAACKLLPADSSWPSGNDWKQHLPAAVARGPQQSGLAHPDYRLEAKNVDDVISAVKFAAMHNIRLSAIHSGHDGLARYGSVLGICQTEAKIT